MKIFRTIFFSIIVSLIYFSVDYSFDRLENKTLYRFMGKETKYILDEQKKILLCGGGANYNLSRVDKEKLEYGYLVIKFIKLIVFSLKFISLTLLLFFSVFFSRNREI